MCERSITSILWSFFASSVDKIRLYRRKFDCHFILIFRTLPSLNFNWHILLRFLYNGLIIKSMKSLRKRKTMSRSIPSVVRVCFLLAFLCVSNKQLIGTWPTYLHTRTNCILFLCTRQGGFVFCVQVRLKEHSLEMPGIELVFEIVVASHINCIPHSVRQD